MGFNLALSFYVYMNVCMYVCIRMYFRCRTCLRIHACVHVRTYTSMTYIRIHICVLGFMCLTCVGPAMRATHTYIHTYDVVAHCAAVAQRHRYSSVMSLHVHMYAHRLTWIYVGCMRWASYESYSGLHAHKQCCRTLCYCSMTPSLLVCDESTQNH